MNGSDLVVRPVGVLNAKLDGTTETIRAP